MNFENVKTEELKRKFIELRGTETGACLREWLMREIERCHEGIETSDVHDLPIVNLYKGNIQAYRVIERLLNPHLSAPGQ